MPVIDAKVELQKYLASTNHFKGKIKVLQIHLPIDNSVKMYYK